MNDKRRSAADALNTDLIDDAKIKSFIRGGVPDEAENEVRTSVFNSPGNVAVELEPTESEALDDTVAHERKTPVRKTAKKPSRQPKSETAESAEIASSVLIAAMAKASVQKTIRFRPALIAEWESYVHNQRLTGAKPMTFQDVQNEALELWLNQNVPTITR
ncbi:MAG: hypothetical protein R3E01_32920 [Pirellulaceae bacterium]